MRWTLPLAILALGCGGEAPCPEATEATRDACVASCEAGDAPACARIGVAYEAGRLGERGPDPVAAARYFGQACAHAQEGERWLCVLGPSVAEDGRDAAGELQRLCGEGVLLACHELSRPTPAEVAEVPLPGGAAPNGPTYGVRVGQDGALSLDGEPSALEAIRALEPPAGAHAVIAADPEVPYARVIEVIDALRAAGVTRYALNRRAADDAPSGED